MDRRSHFPGRLALARLLAPAVLLAVAFPVAPARAVPPGPGGGQAAERVAARAPKVASKGLEDAATTSAAWRAKHGLYFKRNWGIDIVGVRRVASGYMLRFDYTVVDPERASVLIDRTARPYLIDEATRTALAVPAMENVGELRQVAPLEHGRTYYVIFGNPGGLVRKGGRVSLVVGNFKAEGLVVE